MRRRREWLYKLLASKGRKSNNEQKGDFRKWASKNNREIIAPSMSFSQT